MMAVARRGSECSAGLKWTPSFPKSNQENFLCSEVGASLGVDVDSCSVGGVGAAGLGVGFDDELELELPELPEPEPEPPELELELEPPELLELVS